MSLNIGSGDNVSWNRVEPTAARPTSKIQMGIHQGVKPNPRAQLTSSPIKGPMHPHQLPSFVGANKGNISSSAILGAISQPQTVSVQKPLTSSPVKSRYDAVVNVFKQQVGGIRFAKAETTEAFGNLYKAYLEGNISKEQLFANIDKINVPYGTKLAAKSFINLTDALPNLKSISQLENPSEYKKNDLKKWIQFQPGDKFILAKTNNENLLYGIKYNEKENKVEIYKIGINQNMDNETYSGVSSKAILAGEQVTGFLKDLNVVLEKERKNNEGTHFNLNDVKNAMQDVLRLHHNLNLDLDLVYIPDPKSNNINVKIYIGKDNTPNTVQQANKFSYWLDNRGITQSHKHIQTNEDRPYVVVTQDELGKYWNE